MKKDEFSAELKRILLEKWTGSKICPVCSATNWIAGENIAVLSQYAGRRLTIGGPYYPLVTITCSRCGYTILLNAKILGLTAPEEEPDSSAGKVQDKAESGQPGDGQ